MGLSLVASGTLVAVTDAAERREDTRPTRHPTLRRVHIAHALPPIANRQQPRTEAPLGPWTLGLGLGLFLIWLWPSLHSIEVK